MFKKTKNMFSASLKHTIKTKKILSKTGENNLVLDLEISPWKKPRIDLQEKKIVCASLIFL